MKFIFLIFALIPATLVAQNKEAGAMSYGKKIMLQSKVLNEDRTLWLRLPASYNDSLHAPQHYPVMYVLDGKSAFFPLAGVVSFMSEKENVNFQVPEMIVVGVDTENRLRDLTPNQSSRQPNGNEAQSNSQQLMMKGSGGGENFLKFLTDEVFPAIEAGYRTIPYRLYVGHSLGGLTSTYTMLKHPGIFNSYIAIDPSLWWDSAHWVNNAATMLKNYGTQKIQRYYVSVVDSSQNKANSSFHIQSIHRLGSILTAASLPNLKHKVDVIPGTDHSSIPLLSWYNGLLFVFEGYHKSHFDYLQNPDLLETHFNDLEKKIGLKMPPPQDIFEILIHYLTSPNRFPDKVKALKVMKMALKHYPSSPYLLQKLREIENSSEK
jgi:uncharacterized protein